MGMYLLDHSDFATTERYYIAALAAAAQGKYQDLIEASRKACAQGNRPSRLGTVSPLAPASTPAGAQRRLLLEKFQ